MALNPLFPDKESFNNYSIGSLSNAFCNVLVKPHGYYIRLGSTKKSTNNLAFKTADQVSRLQLITERPYWLLRLNDNLFHVGQLVIRMITARYSPV